MFEKDPKDMLARENQQQGTLGKNRAIMYSSRDGQAQMELDWPYFAETNRPDATMQAPEWNPQGKRKVGRPVKTWRRSVEEELKQANITWNAAKKKPLTESAGATRNTII